MSTFRDMSLMYYHFGHTKLAFPYDEFMILSDYANSRHAFSALFLIYIVFVNLDGIFVNKNSLAIHA